MKTGDADRTGDWSQTYVGKELYILDPREEEICITDIAHALSNLCRFNGHCSSFHSVAAHSVLVSHLCKPKNALWGLLHDASEAYTGDMVSPLKRYMPEFQKVEDRLMEVICSKYGLPPEMPDDVAEADLQVLALEKKHLLREPPRPWVFLEGVEVPDIKLQTLPPTFAEIMFLHRFYELGDE